MIFKKIHTYFKYKKLINLYTQFEYVRIFMARDPYFKYYYIKYLNKLYRFKYKKFKIKLYLKLKSKVYSADVIKYCQILNNEFVCYENNDERILSLINGRCNVCRWITSNCHINTLMIYAKKGI